MTLKIYIAPETEVVFLNAKDAMMDSIGFDPTLSTTEQYGNTAEFDNEGGDPFFDN